MLKLTAKTTCAILECLNANIELFGAMNVRYMAPAVSTMNSAKNILEAIEHSFHKYTDPIMSRNDSERRRTLCSTSCP